MMMISIYIQYFFSIRIVHKVIYLIKPINQWFPVSKGITILKNKTEKTPATASGKDAMLGKKEQFLPLLNIR